MALIVPIQMKRGTRAQINAAKTANGLKVGEPYLVADEGRVDVGTATNATVSLATKAEVDGKAAVSHTHPASSISDSTSTGRALMTAAAPASARSALNDSYVLGAGSQTATLVDYPIPSVGTLTAIAQRVIWLFEDALFYQTPAYASAGYLSMQLRIMTNALPGLGNAFRGFMDVTACSGTNYNGIIGVMSALCAAFNPSITVTPVRVPVVVGGAKTSYRYGVLIKANSQADGQKFIASGMIQCSGAAGQPLHYPYFTDVNYYGALETVPNSELLAGGSGFQINGSKILTPRNIVAADIAGVVPVTSVAGKTGTVSLVKADVGLGNVDNTSDAAKPISTATQAALDGKASLAALDGKAPLTGAGTSGTWAISITGASRAITVMDTRSVVSQPNQVANQTAVFDFKFNTSVGNPPAPASSTYAHVLTVNGWSSDGTGGWPTQVSFGERMAYRKGATATTWGAWRTLLDSDNIKTVNGYSLMGSGNIQVGQAEGANLPVVAYDDRASLRSRTAAARDLILVDTLGLFSFSTDSTEPDDDESCFVGPTGRWLLQCPHWDLVDAWMAPDDDARDARLDAVEAQLTASGGQPKILTGSATCAISSLAGTSSASFSGTVTGAQPGDRVLATPPAELGQYSSDTPRLSYYAWVSVANTVTVMLTNASASYATINPAVQTAWPVTVFKT